MKLNDGGDRIKLIDLTPMIDVVLLLIIFFLLTSRLSDEARSALDLPRQAGEFTERPQEPDVILDIASDGMLLIASRPVELSQFAALVATAQLRIEGREPTVLIRPDRTGGAESLNAAVRELARLGISRWSMGTLDGNGIGISGGEGG